MNTDFNKNNVLDFEKYLTNVKRYSKNTVDAYINSISMFFNYCKKDSVRIYMNDIDNYIEYLVMQKQSFSTQNIFISSVILYFKKFHPGRRFVNKLERPKNKERLPETLSKEEINQLINSYANIKHKALIAFIYYHGLRRSEAKNFKISKFDKSNGIILIEQSKGRKDRKIGLNLKCRQILIKYFKEYNPKEYLFNGQNSMQYSVESMAKVLQQGLNRVGINKHITLHSLRHSFACHLYDQCVQLSDIQLILGHSSEKTTKIYAKASTDHIKQIQIAS